MPPVTAKKPGAPPAQPRALRADARRNREAVLKAARERFAEDGMAAQIDDIAKAAKVGVGTVYRHFPNKEDLVEAIVEAYFATVAAFGETAIEDAEDGEPWAAFQEYMRRCVEVQSSDRALSQVAGSHPELMFKHAEGSGAWEHVQELVRLTKRAGEMRGDADPDDIPMIICGLGAVAERCRATGAPDEWRRFLAIALDGLRVGPPGELPAVARRLK